MLSTLSFLRYVFSWEHKTTMQTQKKSGFFKEALIGMVCKIITVLFWKQKSKTETKKTECKITKRNTVDRKIVNVCIYVI